MALLLYLITSVLLLFVSSRYYVTITRRAMVVLLLMPLCFTGYSLVTGRIYAPLDIAFTAAPLKPYAEGVGITSVRSGALNDIYSQMIPWRAAVRYALSHYEWPLWNPFTLCGDILAASAQPAVYYPFNLLSNLIPAADALTYVATITFLVAGLSAFLFLRSIGCSEIAALVGSAGWMFSDFVAFWQAWPLGVSASLLPLVCHGVRSVVDRPSMRSGLILTIALVLLILAGHPETVLHCIAVSIAFGIFEISRTGRDRWVSTIGLACAAGAVSLLLTAIYLLPILEALPQTADHQYRHEVYRLQDHTLKWPTSLGRIVGNFAPLMHGLQGDDQLAITGSLPPASAYAGTLILSLAILGVWRGAGRERWFMVGAILLGLLFGASAPVTFLFQKLPLFDIAINERLSFAATFGLISLAAIGLDVLLREHFRSFAIASAAAALVVLGCSAVTVQQTLSGRIFAGNVTATLVPILTLGVAVGVTVFRGRTATGSMLLVLVLAERSIAMAGFYPSVPREAFFPEVDELRSIPRTGVSRMTSLFYTFLPNVSAIYGLEDVRGYQAMNFKRLVQIKSFWSIPQPIHYNRIDQFHPFLSFLNVRYLLVGNHAPFEKDWPELARGRSMRVIKNPGALERAFVPRAVRIGSSTAETIAAMARETDFAARSWIEAIPDLTSRYWIRSAGQPWENGTAEFLNGPGTVSVSRQGTGLKIDARMAKPGWVVVSEPGWSGWRARTKDAELPIFFANHAFIAFRLPAGVHSVKLYFQPLGFVVGRAITFASTVLGILLLVLHNRTRNRRRAVAANVA